MQNYWAGSLCTSSTTQAPPLFIFLYEIKFLDNNNYNIYDNNNIKIIIIIKIIINNIYTFYRLNGIPVVIPLL